MIIIWIALSLLVGFIGRNRTCGFLLSFLCSIILSPLVGFIWVALCKRKKTQIELLQEAKTYLDTGVLNEKQYKEMVADIMNGKQYTAKYYIEKPTKIYR